MKNSWIWVAGIGSGCVIFLLGMGFSIASSPEGEYKPGRAVALSLIAASGTAIVVTAAATIAESIRQAPAPALESEDNSRSQFCPDPIDLANLASMRHPYDSVKDVLGPGIEQQVASIAAHVGASNALDGDGAARLFDSAARLIEVSRQAEPAHTAGDSQPVPSQPMSSPAPKEIILPDVPRSAEGADFGLSLDDDAWFPDDRLPPPPIAQASQPAPAPPPPPQETPLTPKRKPSSFGGFPLI